MIGQSEKSGIEIESEYQLTGHPVFHKSAAKGWPPQPLKERVPNIIEKLDFYQSIPQKEAVKVAEANKIRHYLKPLHFWLI